MTRTTWAEVPTTVRRALEEALGDQVEEAASQSGGFSSGSADRLVLRSGRRVFAKSVSRSRNAGTHELHRREAAVVRGLPASVSAPRVVATVEQDDWVVVAFEDVDGRPPGRTTRRSCSTRWPTCPASPTPRCCRASRTSSRPTPRAGCA